MGGAIAAFESSEFKQINAESGDMTSVPYTTVMLGKAFLLGGFALLENPHGYFDTDKVNDAFKHSKDVKVLGFALACYQLKQQLGAVNEFTKLSTKREIEKKDIAVILSHIAKTFVKVKETLEMIHDHFKAGGIKQVMEYIMNPENPAHTVVETYLEKVRKDSGATLDFFLDIECILVTKQLVDELIQFYLLIMELCFNSDAEKPTLTIDTLRSFPSTKWIFKLECNLFPFVKSAFEKDPLLNLFMEEVDQVFRGTQTDTDRLCFFFIIAAFQKQCNGILSKYYKKKQAYKDLMFEAFDPKDTKIVEHEFKRLTNGPSKCLNLYVSTVLGIKNPEMQKPRMLFFLQKLQRIITVLTADKNPNHNFILKVKPYIDDLQTSMRGPSMASREPSLARTNSLSMMPRHGSTSLLVGMFSEPKTQEDVVPDNEDTAGESKSDP